MVCSGHLLTHDQWSVHSSFLKHTSRIFGELCCVDLYGCVNGHLCVVCQGGARDEEITKISPGARFQDRGWLGAVNTDRSGRLLSKEGLVRLYLEHHQASWDVTGSYCTGLGCFYDVRPSQPQQYQASIYLESRYKPLVPDN